MGDYYVYYEGVPNDQTKGIIKAISPVPLAEMEELEHIRIPAEEGLAFTVGGKSLNAWAVAWNNDLECMAMTEMSAATINTAEFIFLQEIPTAQKKPQVSITYSKSDGAFLVKTRGVSISHPNVTMLFFITRKGDPNILLYHFQVALYETMSRKGFRLPCDVDLPKVFSVYTKPDLDRYQLRIQQ